MFDTYFVQFSQVLAVSGPKTLAIRNWYVEVAKSQPHLDYFQNTHSKMKTNIRLWMYTLNGNVWYLFCSVWSSISCFRPENVSYISNRYAQVVKSQPHLDYFQNTHSKMKTNIRLWMYTLNGTVWYPFCSVWSSISCFRPENVSYKKLICRSGKITIAPRLFSDHSLKTQNKHQIMNVLTKWNCLIPILFSLVKH